MVGSNGIVAWAKNAYKTTKYLPYGMLSALLKTKKENPK